MTRQPVLAVDLDGVVADYFTAFRRFLSQHRGVPAATFPDDVDYDLTRWGVAAGEYPALHRTAVVEHQLFARMAPIAGAPEALQALSCDGVRIRIATYRLCVPSTHAQAVTQTVTWLDEHRIPYDDLCFVRAKGTVEADVYVDDAPEHVRDLEAAGRCVITFTTAANRDLTPAPLRRADTWKQAEALVREQLGLPERSVAA